jgi:hypothetical protein
MIKNSITLFLLVSGWSLCAQPTLTFHIDPDNARGGSAGQVFDSVEFIPLETSKESLFGSIDQMEVTDSLFIILDTQGRSILLFYRTGRFYKRITTGGLDKYFYWFALDRSRGEIAVTNNYSGGLLIYDLQGRFVRKERCPEHSESLYHLPGNRVWYNLQRGLRYENTDHILYDLCCSNGYDSVVRKFKPYNAHNEANEYNIGASPLNYSGEPGSCMYSMPYEYTIYQLNDTGILHKFQLVFPLLYSLPPNFATDGAYRNKRAKYAYSTPGNERLITCLERPYKYGQYLLYSADSRQLWAGADYNFAYNMTTGTLISFSKVTGDSSTAYLPILSSLLERIGTIYDGKIIASTPAFRLFTFRDGTEKKSALPPSLQTFFSNGKRTDNPVVIQFKLRPDL